MNGIEVELKVEEENTYSLPFWVTLLKDKVVDVRSYL